MTLEAISHAEAYRRFNQGQYAPIVKDGRSTKIWGWAIDARRDAKLAPFKLVPALNAPDKAG
jgi:hypothetical protein